jgi:hypothetical protein
MRRLSIVNRSSHTISCRKDNPELRPKGGEEVYDIPPSETVVLDVDSLCLNLTLFSRRSAEKSTTIHDDWLSGSRGLNGVEIGHVITLGATWAAVKVSEGCPWVIYRSKVRSSSSFAIRSSRVFRRP